MTINDQIEAAWKERCGENIHHPPGAGWVYRQGYIDAVRRQWIEITHGEAAACDFDNVHLQTMGGEWFPMTGISSDEKTFYVFCLEDASKVKVPVRQVRRIVRLHIPTPSDIFGEEG